MRRIIIGVSVLIITALTAGLFNLAFRPTDVPLSGQAAPAQVGYLRVDTIPPATEVLIDGQAWPAPPEIAVGKRKVRLVARGYDPVDYELEIADGQTVTLRGTLSDTMPPSLHLSAQPTLPSAGETVTVWIETTDNGSGLAQMDFTVDDTRLHTEPLTGPADRLELQVESLSPGLHTLTAVVSDFVGNVSREELFIDVRAVAPMPSVDVAAVELPAPGEVSVTSTPAPAETPVTVSTPTPIIDQAVIFTETLSIPAYGYAGALDRSGARPQLDANKMTGPETHSYEAVILENDALRLTVLPELGGRIWQVEKKDVGQKFLYNNPVIKPTRWGPPDMNWWLAGGGIEWAYPVEEHGYAWADTWAYGVETAADGVNLTLTHTDTPTNLEAQVVIFLPAQGQYFTLSPSVTNTGDAPMGAQLWLSAAFLAGAEQRLDFPAEQIKVHSAGEAEGVTGGQVLPWQPELAAWGRWQTWFGAFAAPASSGEMWVRGNDGGTIKRSFNPAEAPGVKWFTWGPGSPVEEWAGKPYFEIWGGLTADFNTYINLQPGETRGWQEMWSMTDEN